MIALRAAITALCAVGCYASVFLFRKRNRLLRERRPESSVVMTPFATLVPGVPNALVGLAFYLLVAAGSWSARACVLLVFLVSAAAATSVYLAFVLARRLRASCPFCWTAHAVNWALALLVTLTCLTG